MQSGEYITDRLLPNIVRDIGARQAISVRSFSDDWLLELTKGDVTRHIVGYKFGLNDSATAATTQDKVAAYLLMNAHSVSAVEHRLVRTKASEHSSWYEQTWPRLVVKPLTGTSGHGVRLFDSPSEAANWIEAQGIEAWAVSPYLEIQAETRLIMLDSEPLLAYTKQPVMIHGLAMFNLGKGAVPHDITPDHALVTLARNAQRALGLRLAAVDIVTLTTGEQMVLEVNDGLMMEHYARVSPENFTTTVRVYESVIRALY